MNRSARRRAYLRAAEGVLVFNERGLYEPLCGFWWADGYPELDLITEGNKDYMPEPAELRAMLLLLAWAMTYD